MGRGGEQTSQGPSDEFFRLPPPPTARELLLLFPFLCPYRSLLFFGDEPHDAGADVAGEGERRVPSAREREEQEMRDEGQQKAFDLLGAAAALERLADRGGDGALHRGAARSESPGQRVRRRRLQRGGRREDTAAASQAQHRDSRNKRGGGGTRVVAGFGGLRQRGEQSVGDARRGPGRMVAALCEREEAGDGLRDDVLKRLRLSFFSVVVVVVSVVNRSIASFSLASRSHRPATRSHLAPMAQARIDNCIECATGFRRRRR